MYDSGKNEDIQTLGQLSDDKSKQKRCEKLEDLVNRERLNKFKHACDEYAKFVPRAEDRIKIDTQALIAANSN